MPMSRSHLLTTVAAFALVSSEELSEEPDHPRSPDLSGG